MKNKPNFFLACLLACFFQEQVLLEKIKEQGFLRKSPQKTYPLDPGSGKIHPGSGSRIPGGKKHRKPDPDPQH
jgi:hypothetical protein